MRDLMAITERPEIISLAGGLPDTSTFPTDTFAAMTDRIARAFDEEVLLPETLAGIPEYVDAKCAKQRVCAR